ncbi:MAG TPA: hypothetical protein VGU46_06015 [Acidobacteriaceae bacterium]|nr:hypothetical protein [Acidobacteriaceae bacterium]
MLLPYALRADQSQPPSLNQILQRLEVNLNRYDTHIPGFFADEHIVSQVAPGTRDQNTLTDSTFRLKRTIHPDHTATLDESRDVKSVNGRPASSQDLAGPTVVSGAFEGALAVVSFSQSTCTRYTLDHNKRKDPTAPYIIRFASVLTSHDSPACLLDEKSKGRVFIDPIAMQITHLELTTPHHTIIPGDASSSAITGPRTLVVDYAPILFNSETFWLPSTIMSHSTTGAGTYHRTDWTFKATYRNFHKLEVTSRILPSIPAENPPSTNPETR